MADQVPKWEQDKDGDWFYDGACVCPHNDYGIRVGYDWGLRLALFSKLETAKSFVEGWSRRRAKLNG